MSDDSKIAELQAQIDALKAAQPKPYDPVAAAKAAAEWDNEMHQMREARARHAIPPAVVRDWAAVPDDVVKGIMLRDSRAPSGPSSQGIVPSSQQISAVRGAGVPGGGTGWAREVPLSSPPGINYVDALCIADDVRQRAEKK